LKAFSWLYQVSKKSPKGGKVKAMKFKLGDGVEMGDAIEMVAQS